MKILDGYILRTVAGKNIVVSVAENANFNGMLTLNDTGVFFWNLHQTETTKDEMLKKVLAEYDVPPAVAEADIDEFIKKLADKGILEE